MKFKLTHKQGNYLGELFCDYGQGYEKLFDTLDPLIIPNGSYSISLYASADWAQKSLCQLSYYVPILSGNGADGHYWEIHILNTLADSKACIGVGDLDLDNKTQPALKNSSATFIKFLCLLYGDIVEHQVKKWELIIE